jgi:hypothetical protein
MTIQKNYLFLTVLLLIFSVSVFAKEKNELKIEIKAYSSEIKVGEPLVLKILVTCSTPNINPKTGKTTTSGGISEPYLIITKKGQKEEIKYEYDPILHKPLPIFGTDKEGLEFTGSLIVFYDQIKKVLLFNESGIYSCRLESTRDKIVSNTIEINVKHAGKQEEKAISILTGKYDMMILETSDDLDRSIIKEFPGLLERFEQVVEQCKDTMVAKMAAAKLGVKTAEELENKYPDGEKFLDQYNKGEIKEPLIESAKKYLSMAYNLPDEFPVRETVLNKLAVMELFEGKNQKVNSLFDELASKYPNGEFGKHAEKDKEEFNTLMKRFPDLKEEQENKNLLGVALPIAGAAVAVIVIAGVVMFLRKKKLKKLNNLNHQE